MALIELLHMDRDLDELIARRATARELRNVALEKGFRTLADDGIRRILEGMTSLAGSVPCGGSDRAAALTPG